MQAKKIELIEAQEAELADASFGDYPKEDLLAYKNKLAELKADLKKWQDEAREEDPREVGSLLNVCLGKLI